MSVDTPVRSQPSAERGADVLPRPPIEGVYAARAFGALGLVLLLGYAIGDKGFAYLKPPGPVFLSEVLLGLGLVVLLTHPYALARVLRSTPVLSALFLFITLGALRTLPYLRQYGLDAIRDAALWYYGLFAFIFATLFVAYPTFLGAALRLYARFLPILLVWIPIGAFMARRDDLIQIADGVSLFASKSGNAAIHGVIGFGFVMFFGERYYTRGVRQLLAALALISVLAAASQARGGMLGAAVALGIIVVFLGKRRAATIATVLIVGGATFGVLLATGASIKTDRGREISAEQLVVNAASIASGGEGEEGNLGTTAEWRRYLWRNVIEQVQREQAELVGVGFGREMGSQFLEWNIQFDRPLRSPHNSHLDVWVRMGYFGLGFWLVLWASWFGLVGSFALRGLRRPSSAANLSALCIAGVAGILVNSFVDPTMEGPQVAIWAWMLAGLGVALAVGLVRVEEANQAESK